MAGIDADLAASASLSGGVEITAAPVEPATRAKVPTLAPPPMSVHTPAPAATVDSKHSTAAAVTSGGAVSASTGPPRPPPGDPPITDETAVEIEELVREASLRDARRGRPVSVTASVAPSPVARGLRPTGRATERTLRLTARSRGGLALIPKSPSCSCNCCGNNYPCSSYCDGCFKSCFKGLSDHAVPLLCILIVFLTGALVVLVQQFPKSSDPWSQAGDPFVSCLTVNHTVVNVTTGSNSTYRCFDLSLYSPTPSFR